MIFTTIKKSLKKKTKNPNQSVYSPVERENIVHFIKYGGPKGNNLNTQFNTEYLIIHQQKPQ